MSSRSLSRSVFVGLLTLAVSGLSIASLAATPAADVNEPLPLLPGLESRVEFWRSIYTRYTTRQVVVHDALLPEVVYGVVELGGTADGGQMEYPSDRDLTRQSRERVQMILTRLATGQEPSTDEERLVLKALSGVTGEDRLTLAVDRVRTQRGQSDRFRAGLVRAGRYVDAFRALARAEGVPEDLALLPHVESSFEQGARSHVGAAGMWQFMAGTGRRFLTIDVLRDERLDPWLAARAAFRLLRENYDLLGSWPLALTAYNHGQGGTLRARGRFGDDLVSIIEGYDGRTFGFASRNFYAEFLAARDIAARPGDFFGPIDPEAPMEFEWVRLDRPAGGPTLAERWDVGVGVLAALNPALRPDVWSGRRSLPAGFEVRLPAEAFARVQSSQAAARATAEVPTEVGLLRHVVRRGETLASIAVRYGTAVSHLVLANGLRDASRINVGQTLVIPVGR